jgi:hypothetical protein
LKRGLRRVPHIELDLLGYFFSAKKGGHFKRAVDTCRNARRADEIAVLHYTRLLWRGAEMGS